MLTFFAVILLIVFVGILFGAAIVEVQKTHHARTHSAPAWHHKRKLERDR